MTEKAMRNADGEAVFVREDGSYSHTFPTENILREVNASNTMFVIYGFVGTNSNFEEKRWVCETEQQAVEKATEIYGRDDVEGFTRAGEVFEVEVHEVREETAQKMGEEI